MINENIKGQNMNNYDDEEDQKEIRQNISNENN